MLLDFPIEARNLNVQKAHKREVPSTASVLIRGTGRDLVKSFLLKKIAGFKLVLDLEGISKAIEKAKSITDKPSIIKVTTTIGYGSPNKSDTAGIHGAPLGEEEAELTRKQLGWSYKPFEVPQDAYDQYRQAIQKGAQLEDCLLYTSPSPRDS